MTISQKAKGPAEVAASPSHGSQLPQKGNLNVQTHTPDRPKGQVAQKPDFTRRSFLGRVAAVPALVALPAASVAAEVSPLDRATHHLEQFRLAMMEHTGTPWVTKMSVRIGAAFATEVG